MSIDASAGLFALPLKAVPSEISLAPSNTYLVFSVASHQLQVVQPGNVQVDPPVPNSPVAGTTTTIGFLGATPVTKQTTYTQTYATAASTVNPTATAAFTGVDNTQVGTVYATVADLNTLRTDMLMAMQLINKLIDNMQAYGLAG